MIPSINKEARHVCGIGLDKIEEKFPRLFMGMVHHRDTNGDRLTFSDKKWLADIYKDNARYTVYMKCSQVHMTELALCTMYTLAHNKRRGMYILPSSEHRKTFVSDRINRMKDWSPLYEKSLKEGTKDGSDSNVYKTIFGVGWKFVGSNVRKDFFEFPCHALFFDEYDLLNQENIKYAYDRIANTQRPHISKFGNPTRDNFGIHAEWLQSDQREWHVECHCGHEQILDWYTHFVKDVGGSYMLRHITGQPVCEKCGETFDRLGPGRWIALNPGSKVHGYRISRLFVRKTARVAPTQDIFKLYVKFMNAQNDPTALQNFHNNYLAMTYENIDFKITEELLQKCALKDKLTYYDPQVFRSVMGVDQGKVFSCTISIVVDGVLYDVHYADVDEWSDVEDLENKWNVIMTVVDAQGGGYAETRKFIKAKGGRYMCFYRPKDQLKKTFDKTEKTQTVLVNRTELLDLVVKSLKDGKCIIPKDYKQRMRGKWKKQMLESARVTDAGGRPVWTKGTDHFFHSMAYRYLAFLMSGMKNSVHTSQSWHTDREVEKERAVAAEPQERIIGEIVEKPPTPKPKRSWHS